MKEIFTKRLSALLKLMNQKGYDFYYIPSSDAHNSEYVPTCWKNREWISGFTGSAGDALIHKDMSYLSTDGRYFEQAEAQLDPSHFTLLKQEGYSSKIDDLLATECANKVLAFDPSVVTVSTANRLTKLINSINGKLIYDKTNLVSEARDKLNDIAKLPCGTPFIHTQEYAGESFYSKYQKVLKKLQDNHIDALAISTLDEIAWFLNIRGSDIDYNPLVISYVLVTRSNVTWYIDEKNLDKIMQQYLDNNAIKIQPYTDFYKDLESYSGKIGLDPNTANYAMYQACHEKPVLLNSPIILMKAIKNSTEAKNSQYAHQKDALAYIEFLYWLEHNWQGQSEISAQEKLSSLRARQHNARGDSFGSISGHAQNGAYPHYSATNKTNEYFDNNNLYLLDSGGQYLEGTTDITRVFHFGRPTKEHKKYYTLVLKGHLALGNIVFPKGTTGSQLDVLARQFLWLDHNNYSHGTGHGVGSYLCVHEGPHRISPAPSSQVLIPGMIVSNEPGVYFCR